MNTHCHLCGCEQFYSFRYRRNTATLEVCIAVCDNCKQPWEVDESYGELKLLPEADEELIGKNLAQLAPKGIRTFTMLFHPKTLLERSISTR